jgi:hypothetical protein
MDSCECGWKETPGCYVRCDSIINGPCYCPDCDKVLNSTPKPAVLPVDSQTLGYSADTDPQLRVLPGLTESETRELRRLLGITERIIGDDEFAGIKMLFNKMVRAL